MDLDPLWPFAHWMLGHTLSQMGRHNEAASPMRRARELDPLSAVVHAISSQVAFQARDYSAALDHAQQAISSTRSSGLATSCGRRRRAPGEDGPGDGRSRARRPVLWRQQQDDLIQRPLARKRRED